VIGLVLVALLCTGPDRDRDRAEAETHARKAEALVAQGDYDDAERELHSAYALDSSPYHLFGLGMVAKLRGDCDRAIGYFERVLEGLPTSELTSDAKRSTEASAIEQIRACGGEPPTDPDPEPVPSPSVSPDASAVEPSAPTPAPRVPSPRVDRPWHRDPTGAVLLGLGSAAVAAGTGLIVGGAVIDARADDAPRATRYVAAAARARALGVAGVVVTAVGASLVIGAITRFVVVKRTTRKGRAARAMAARSRCCSR
jgi:tetratricopeptide (TPR) repeat protein